LPVTNFNSGPEVEALWLEPDASKAEDYTGSPWPTDGSRSLVVEPTGDCFDDEATLNEVVAAMPGNGLRNLMKKAIGDPLSCADIVLRNLCDAPVMLQPAAKFCPISCCADNKYSFGCRISCACTEPESVTDLNPTNPLPLCLDAQYKLPHVHDNRDLREFKTTAPRYTELLKPLGMTVWQANAWADSVCKEEPLASSYGGTDKKGVKYFKGPLSSDTLMTFYKGFTCMAQKYGYGSWDDIAKFNQTASKLFMEECLPLVDFQGFTGRVKFSGNGRDPSSVPYMTYNSRWSNTIVKKAGQGTTVTGMVVDGTYVETQRDFGRQDSQACHRFDTPVQGLDACPPGTSYFWSISQPEFLDRRPLDGPPPPRGVRPRGG
jgi:hypothetical protein